jgi:hypothetical protein
LRVILDDIDLDLVSHQIGMQSMVDMETARITEQLFKERFSQHLDELSTQLSALRQAAEEYDCSY